MGGSAVPCGVAVALGQAGLQLTAGLGQTFGTPTGVSAQLTVIGVTTIAFMISASTAVEKGVNYLSQISMYVAGLLLVIFLIDRKSTRLNSSHANISYAVFCL